MNANEKYRKLFLLYLLKNDSSNSLQVRQNSDAVNYVHRIKDMKDERISVF